MSTLKLVNRHYFKPKEAYLSLKSDYSFKRLLRPSFNYTLNFFRNYIFLSKKKSFVYVINKRDE